MPLAGAAKELFVHGFNLFLRQTLPLLTFGQCFPEVINRGLEAFNRSPQSLNGIQQFSLKQ
jgi:hypothetical protein